MRRSIFTLIGIYLVVVAFAAVLFVGFPIWVGNAPAAPLSKMSQLRSGMSQAEVRQLLGEPGSRHVYDDGSESWAYSRMTWAILYVEFDPQGKLTDFRHDR